MVVQLEQTSMLKKNRSLRYYFQKWKKQLIHSQEIFEIVLDTDAPGAIH